jgi:3-hydroxyacyl-CoA dehydrogenase
MTSNTSRRLTVVGAGTMGHGIAEVAAVAGHEVTPQEVDLDLAREGVNRVATDLEGAVDMRDGLVGDALGRSGGVEAPRDPGGQETQCTREQRA